MSRVRTDTPGRAKITAVVGVAVSAALVLGGCSAGQITQTDAVQPAVNGASTSAGPIALRDVQLAYPNGQNYYPRGADVPLVMTAVNSGTKDDQLVSVSSPWFTGATVTGNRSLPAGIALSSGTDPDDRRGAPMSAPMPMSSAPSSSAGPGKPSFGVPPVGPVGTVQITLTGLNKDALRPGISVPVVFTFALGGRTTAQVPIGAPSDNS